MKIGVYIGSFNPFHLGHVKVIEYLKEQGFVDKIEVIPTGAYWDKNNLIDIKHRINMIKIYESKDVIVNDELNNIPYTYQILNLLKKKYPNDELILIIGDDNLPKFHLWKNYQEILNNKVLVLKRDNVNIEDTISYKVSPKSFIIVSDFKKLDISSTMIRSYLQEERYYDALNYLGIYVLMYIIENNLYGVFDVNKNDILGSKDNIIRDDCNRKKLIKR